MTNKTEININGEIWVRKDTPATGGFGRMYRHKPTGRIYEKHENKAHPDGVYRCDQYGGFLIEPVMVEYGNDFEKIVPSTPPGIVKMKNNSGWIHEANKHCDKCECQIWTIRDTEGREFSIGETVAFDLDEFNINEFVYERWEWCVIRKGIIPNLPVRALLKSKLPPTPLEQAINEKDWAKGLRILSEKIK